MREWKLYVKVLLILEGEIGYNLLENLKIKRLLII
jgi:hypothetical protein